MSSRVLVSHNYEYMSSSSKVVHCLDPQQFILKIRQQPIQARQSTNNERDRRPLDPPPIIQIELDNSTAQQTQDFLQNPYLFMSVTLVHSNTQEAISTQNILTGQTASSMYKLKDINNHDGGFFVFGDLSVKLEGQFRLKFSMFKITKVGATNLSSIYSNVFQVYSPKTFPGMLESTFLSRSFSDQGVRIRIRKEHRVQMNISRKRKMSIQEEEQQQEERVFGYPRLLHPYYHSHASLYHPSLSRQPQGHVWYNDHRQQRRRDIDIPTSHSLPHPLCLDRQPFADPTRLGYANRYDKFYYCNRTPPLHLSFMKPTEPTKPCRRQSAECLPYSRHLNESRRMSLQSHPMPSSPERIQLPPLRSMFTPQEDLVQVDAAVAMMQLASTLN